MQSMQSMPLNPVCLAAGSIPVNPRDLKDLKDLKDSLDVFFSKSLVNLLHYLNKSKICHSLSKTLIQRKQAIHALSKSISCGYKH